MQSPGGYRRREVRMGRPVPARLLALVDAVGRTALPGSGNCHLPYASEVCLGSRWGAGRSRDSNTTRTSWPSNSSLNSTQCSTGLTRRSTSTPAYTALRFTPAQGCRAGAAAQRSKSVDAALRRRHPYSVCRNGDDRPLSPRGRNSHPAYLAHRRQPAHHTTRGIC